MRDYRAVGIYQYVSMLPQKCNDFFKQLNTVGTEVGVIVIGKQSAYIPKRRCAEQRVHKRMGQNISVRVAKQSLFIGYVDSTEDELTVFNELMNIISVPDTHYLPLLSARMPSAI